MKNLTDLPIELILKIFNYLEYDDLIILKNLNEEWSGLVGRCFEAKIVVINGGESSYKSSLCNSSYLVGRSLIGFKLDTDLHFWIRKLVLFHPGFIFDLIGFDNLIDLEIYLKVEANENENENPGKLLLRIKNLKSLAIYHYLKDLKICLDTPKLINLDVDSINKFKIIHPHSIKYLKNFDAFNKKMNPMNNLEELFSNLNEETMRNIGELILTNLNIDEETMNQIRELILTSSHEAMNQLDNIGELILTSLDDEILNNILEFISANLNIDEVGDPFNETIYQLSNLEELTLHYLDVNKIGGLFEKLKRLKKFNFYNLRNDLNSTHQFIQSILLLNPTLKIVYKDIELNDDLNLLQIDPNLDTAKLNDKTVPIFMKHLDNISNLTYNYLDISNLDQISIEFIQKLTNLESLRINEITDQEKWIQLLSLPKLIEIEINSFVGQEYFNLIPKYCKFLISLEIDRTENVEWLLQLKNLEYLITAHQFDFEMLKKLINNLKDLKMVRTNHYDEKESYEIKMKHANVECLFNNEIIKTYSKLLFLKTIESCYCWNDLFCNIKVK